MPEGVWNPPASPSRPHVELVSPAGDWDCLRAAVENGADAVYFGLECGFNARMRAANFEMGELPAVMELLHRRGMKGYVALNTLAFPSELAHVEEILRRICDAGGDAVLLQDLGLLRLVRALSPDLAVHASTQMTLTSAESIEVVRKLDVQRVVAARELSLEEIRRICAESPVPLEVFVHGALCVAYSGQCLTSESLGGRSANRGECAQACRLPYELVCDGQTVDLGKVKYLLSPQDLAAYALVPALVAASVSALKIEGRLKKPEYVANITRHYRVALDAALAGQPVQFDREQIEEMELSFSRGFSPGWLEGNDHKRLVPGRSSAKRGVLLGRVKRLHGRRVVVELAAAVAPGDGVVFEGDRAQGKEQGGRVLAMYRGADRLHNAVRAGDVELVLARESLDPRRLVVGQQVWKTDDPQLTSRLRKTFSDPDPRRRVPLDLVVEATVGVPLHVRGQASNGAACELSSPEPLAAAIRRPLTASLLREQLGRLGGTVYELRRLEARIEGEPIVPLSILGRVRREMIELLDASCAALPKPHAAPQAALPRLREELERAAQVERAGENAPGESAPAPTATARPSLHLLCRNLGQLEAAVDCGVASVAADFSDIREYRQAVQIARDRKLEIFLATPRIHKPGENGIFRAVLRHGADGMLVRNLAGLQFCRQHQVRAVADFALNAANELSVHFLREHGAERVTASYDLNRDQLLELVAAVPPRWLEVVVHQHMPLFHMEHCVFCAVLSPGTNPTNCGRPCDRHRVQLRDRVGVEHPLTADVGCRNTLFNAVPQSGAEAVSRLVTLGVRHFRVELLDEDRDCLRTIVGLYQQLLAGCVSGQDVWRALRAANRVGITRGTLEQRRDPLAIL